jgi:hypothetical protein
VTNPVGHLIGRTCRGVKYDDETRDWVFAFDDVALRVAAPWRVVLNGRIVLGWRDHAQSFGLPAPVDAVQVATSFFCCGPVIAATVDATSGDLDVEVSKSCSLQVFNDSSGYEGWQLYGPAERAVIAQGGGRVVSLATRR